MIKQILASVLCIISLNIFAQTEGYLYDEKLNAMVQLEEAKLEAKEQEKNILVQLGGNWCPWCIKFHTFCEENSKLDSIIDSNYIYLLVNYSKLNKNEEFLEIMNHPERFGFPVLLVLDEDGNILHIQDSVFLEDEKSYNFQLVEKFLMMWNRDLTK